MGSCSKGDTPEGADDPPDLKDDASAHTKDEDEDEAEDDAEALICEHCDKRFATVLECGAHEGSCKARVMEAGRIKKKRAHLLEKKPVTCSMCGCTGHLPSYCSIRRHLP